MANVFLTAGNVTATRTVRLAETRPSVGTAPNQTLSAATETSSVATSTATDRSSAGMALTSFTVRLKVKIFRKFPTLSHGKLCVQCWPVEVWSSAVPVVSVFTSA